MNAQLINILESLDFRVRGNEVALGIKVLGEVHVMGLELLRGEGRDVEVLVRQLLAVNRDLLLQHGKAIVESGLGSPVVVVERIVGLVSCQVALDLLGEKGGAGILV